MDDRKFVSLGHSLPPSSSLERILSNADAGGATPRDQLRRWTVRLPEGVASELEAIAEIKGLSINALIMTALDELLVRQGRRKMVELAPWFPEYLQRVGAGKRKRRLLSTETDFD